MVELLTKTLNLYAILEMVIQLFDIGDAIWLKVN